MPRTAPANMTVAELVADIQELQALRDYTRGIMVAFSNELRMAVYLDESTGRYTLGDVGGTLCYTTSPITAYTVWLGITQAAPSDNQSTLAALAAQYGS